MQNASPLRLVDTLYQPERLPSLDSLHRSWMFFAIALGIVGAVLGYCAGRLLP